MGLTMGWASIMCRSRKYPYPPPRKVNRNSKGEAWFQKPNFKRKVWHESGISRGGGGSS